MDRQQISMYNTIQILGEGGMGKVYLATDPKGNKVAIKELRSEFLVETQLRERFKMEIKILSQLQHPSIVKMYSAFEEAGNLYLVMEYVEGKTLDKYLLSTPAGHLSENEAINIMKPIFDGMIYAHDRGIIHRDLKPNNIIINGSRVTILDFGIAKDTNNNGLTVGRIILGTSGYMSPEQANGYSIDKKTDIYSLGCVLHFMLTGTHPFAEKLNEQEMRMTVIREAMPQAKDLNPSVSDHIQDAINTSTQKNMLKRYRDLRDFRNAVTRHSAPDNNIITIGRDENCDVVIPNEYHKVSRLHAEVEHIPNTGSSRYIFRDKSSNGTNVNGRLIRNAAVEFSIDERNSFQEEPEILLAGSVPLKWKSIADCFHERMAVPVAKPVNEPGMAATPTIKSVSQKIVADELDLAWAVLALLVPVIGILMYFNWLADTPKKAKTILIVSIVGFFIGLIITISLL